MGTRLHPRVRILFRRREPVGTGASLQATNTRPAREKYPSTEPQGAIEGR
jgi:hypothetical protein